MASLLIHNYELQLPRPLTPHQGSLPKGPKRYLASCKVVDGHPLVVLACRCGRSCL